MSTPGKEAHVRKSVASGKPQLNRKKASFNDAKGAYVRKKQPVAAPSGVASKRQVSRISASLRDRLAGGAD